MFSIQKLFGRGDHFQQLLESAAQESHESVRLAIELIQSPNNAKKLEELIQSRTREKKISEQIGHELVRTFITGLEREDIEALARALYRIPKGAQKLAERLSISGAHLEGIDFSRHTAMMSQATDSVVGMVKNLRHMNELEQLRAHNERLQKVEVEADKHMTELLSGLYSGKHETLRAIVIRDAYELMEKVVDRCHDAGNVVMYIVLKNS
jgi:uncharacterized protein Yka (UPF0111/DUF47 family)